MRCMAGSLEIQPSRKHRLVPQSIECRARFDFIDFRIEREQSDVGAREPLVGDCIGDTEEVIRDRQVVHYVPVYSINENSWWIHTPKG